ncbi:MAG: ABC transporter permease [Limnochordia bacterium]|jgi:putative ABC transport system permease protein
MSFLFRIAFKNLFRHRLRTLVSIVAIAFSVLLVVFARGYITGMVDTVSVDHIYYNSGHIKLVDRDYREQERLLPLNHPVDGWGSGDLDEMIAELKEIKGMTMVVPRLKFGAMVSFEDELIGIGGWGVDPQKELAFTSIQDYLVEGRMVEFGKMEVAMGTELLRKIDRQVGDKVTVVFNDAFNSLTGATFEIVGRFQSGIKLLNEAVFYLPLDQAQRLLDMKGQTTELLLVTSGRETIDEVLPEVKSLLAQRGEDERYVALSFRETSDLIPWMDLAELIYNQVYVFLVVLACIVVVNTMIMIVVERTQEIGMMAALGLEGRGIMQLFLIEGGLMGVVGSLIGALLGSFLTGYFAKVGMDFSSATSGFSTDIVFDSIVYPSADPGNTIFAFVLGVVIVTLASVLPARKAARLEPTEAMRRA